MDKQTVLFVGTQGSGKGTQIGLLKKYLEETDHGRKVAHFEMGKNLRELAERNDYTGRYTNEILLGGGLIPYAVSSALFATYLMNHLKTNDEHLLIDGFPRTQEQVPALDSAITEFYKRPVPTVVVITISDDEAVKRLLLRGRSDDTEESIRKRLAWSAEETVPTIERFRKNPAYRVVDIDGERAIEAIQADIRAKLSL